MSAKALNCPNCGGSVQSDRTQCEFCNSRLKTVACLSCFGLMFLGTKFCGNCGARTGEVEASAERDPGDCPRCERPLSSIRIGDTPFRECTKCGGFWTNAETFESICVDKERQSAVLTFIKAQTFEAPAQAAVNYVPCPDCKLLMNRSNYARSSGVIIDLCRQHGVWFDADELPRIIDFIDKGGLDRAREKQKLALKDEQSKLRDEQRRLARMQSRSGGGSDSGWSDAADGTLGVVGVLFELGDLW